MDPRTQEKLRAAADAVSQLIDVCRKGGPLYQKDPKAVAQTSRTGKWLLNALAGLRQAIPPSEPEPKAKER